MSRFYACLLAALALATVAHAQPVQTLTVTGTTATGTSALLPLFGSTPTACQLAGIADPYDVTLFYGDQTGSYAISVEEPVSTDPAFDDTILIVYKRFFDPASGCDGFVAIGNEDAGSGLTVTLEAGTQYVLVVAGFFGTEDAYELLVTGPDASTTVEGSVTPGMITGTDGWRMISAPSTSETVGGLLGPLWTQGYPGSDAPTRPASNVFSYNELATVDTDGSGTADLNDGYLRPTDSGDAIPAGTGLFVFVYADDDRTTPAIDGGFPKQLVATGPPAPAPFNFPVSYSNSGVPADDGWTLAGNPFDAGLVLAELVRTNVSDATYVYDTDTDTYLTRSAGTGSLQPILGSFQGFWVQANGATPLLIAPPAAVGTDQGLIGRRAQTQSIALQVSDGAGHRDTAHLAFVDGANAAVDRWDAYELAGFNGPALRLFALAETADGPKGLDIAALPADGGTVALDLTTPASGDLTLSWTALDIPEDWAVVLTDTQTGAEVDLRAATAYTFSAAATTSAARVAADRPGAPEVLRPTASAQARRDGSGRFVLAINAANAVATDGGASETFSLGDPRPNPTQGATAVDLSLAEAGTVHAEVFDALGRHVATIADGTMGAGRHTLRVPVGVLTPGTYIVRVTAAGQVLSRSLTVVR